MTVYLAWLVPTKESKEHILLGVYLTRAAAERDLDIETKSQDASWWTRWLISERNLRD